MDLSIWIIQNQVLIILPSKIGLHAIVWLYQFVQGLDPKTTASLFANAQCLGEKRLGHDDCFVLKVCADRAAVMERNDGSAEVIRHVLYGYFCQKSGLLVYLEDSHLTRVQTPENEIVYW